jgi:TPR repeat protein
MAREVFISHSSLDKPAADAVCSALENTAIRCWIAPRDLQPGRSFAAELYQKAANQGNAAAQNNLGFLYEYGQGVIKDLAKATELYQKSADQGNQVAIANLKRLAGH